MKQGGAPEDRNRGAFEGGGGVSFREVPIGAAFDVRNGATPASGEPRYWDGDIPWVGPADLGRLSSRFIEKGERSITPEGYASCGTQIVPAGSILLSIRAPIGHIAIASKAMCFNQGCRGLVPRKIVRSDFAYWALSACKPKLEAAGQGTTFIELARDKLRTERIPLPDLETQKAIADFLDRETARIDQLIEKKQRLVELLRERSLSAIEKAVTADASLSKLGHHIKILPGYAFASSAFSTNEEDIRLLRGANVSPGKIRWKDVVYWPREATGGLDRFQLEIGDIVMGMDRPWISTGIRVAEITERDVPALLLQRVCKITPLKTLSKEYLKLLLSSKKFLGYLEPELTGVSVPHISGDQIAGFRFPYLPVIEQERRATTCIRVLASNEVIIERAQQSISRLQEYRAALITAAVTGQINVSTWGKRGETDRRLDHLDSCLETPADAALTGGS